MTAVFPVIETVAELDDDLALNASLDEAPSDGASLDAGEADSLE